MPEELQRKVISYKKRFIALVESQVDEMDKFDERLKYAILKEIRQNNGGVL